MAIILVSGVNRLAESFARIGREAGSELFVYGTAEAPFDSPYAGGNPTAE